MPMTIEEARRNTATIRRLRKKVAEIFEVPEHLLKSTFEDGLCQNEREHNQRARDFQGIFTETTLAAFLHQTYRAAFKALHKRRSLPDHMKSVDQKGRLYGGVVECVNEHDHGFDSCHRKAYFLKRARRLLTSVDKRL